MLTSTDSYLPLMALDNFIEISFFFIILFPSSNSAHFALYNLINLICLVTSSYIIRLLLNFIVIIALYFYFCFFIMCLYTVFCASVSGVLICLTAILNVSLSINRANGPTDKNSFKKNCRDSFMNSSFYLTG